MREFGFTAGLADEFNPRSRARGIDGASLEKGLDVRAAHHGVSGLHESVQLGFPAVQEVGLGYDGFKPGLGDFVATRPRGEVQEVVFRVVGQVVEDGVRRSERPYAGQGAIGFELHAGVGVFQSGSKRRNVARLHQAVSFAELAEGNLYSDGIGALQHGQEFGGAVSTTAE